MAQCTPWQSPGHSNPNLLKNWDFRQVVNQREESSYTDAQQAVPYSVDMWKRWNNASVIIVNGKLIINGTLSQPFEIEPDFENKIYTFSAADEYGIVSSCRLSQTKALYNEVTNGVTVAWGTDSGNKELFVYAENKSLIAAKLEVGTVSTLAIDLLQPPNYVAQLRECQRYYYKDAWARLKAATNGDGSALYTMIDLPQNMRINPSINITNGYGLIIGNGTIKQLKDVLNNVAIDAKMKNGQKRLALNFSLNTPLTGHEIYSIEDMEMEFSAEL